MLGKRRVRQENLFGAVRRETRVSRELRALRQILDFDYFREQVKDKFCLDNGRWSRKSVPGPTFLELHSGYVGRMICEPVYARQVESE